MHTRTTALENPRSSHIISNPVSLRIAKPQYLFFATSRRVHTRSTALQNPRSPRSIWHYALVCGCLATGCIIMVVHKSREKSVDFGLRGSVSEEMEVWFQGALPDMFRKGHSVVVEGLFRPVTSEIKNDNAKAKNVASKAKGCEFYFSATEVLSKPDQVTEAIERNAKIMAEKQNVAEEKRQNVAEEKQTAVEEEQEAVADWYSTPSDDISNSAADPSISKSRPEDLVLEAMENQSASSSKLEFSPGLGSSITKLIEMNLVMFQGLPDVLQEGHSFVIKGFFKAIMDEIKEEDKSAKSVTVRARSWECHLSGEVLAKHDEKCTTQKVAAAAAIEE